MPATPPAEGGSYMSKPMEVRTRELRAGLSRWLDRVRAGEELIVTNRRAPVASSASSTSGIPSIAWSPPAW
jgi:hypothetical protein